MFVQILKDNTRISYDWSFFMAWTGVAFSLVSAILFSGAAICLRGEREREEALNMQYLMPGQYNRILRDFFFLTSSNDGVNLLLLSIYSPTDIKWSNAFCKRGQEQFNINISVLFYVLHQGKILFNYHFLI